MGTWFYSIIITKCRGQTGVSSVLSTNLLLVLVGWRCEFETIQTSLQEILTNSKYWNEIYICCRRLHLTNILILESKNVSLFMSLCFCNNLDWVFCAILFFPIFLLKWSHNAYKREIKEILIHWFISIGSAAGRSLAPGSRQPPWAAHRKTWNVVII